MSSRNPPPGVKKRKPLFKLPKTPVDQYEIRWWQLTYDDVVEIRALYHVNTAWRTLFPKENDPRPEGAPFTAQWQYFENGVFSGRAVGWTLDWMADDRRLFATEVEARRAMLEICETRLESKQREIDDLAAKMYQHKKRLAEIA